MKLVSWNVNGLRACVSKGFFDFFNDIDSDIFCVQETKMQEGQAEINSDGYMQFWNSAEKKGYSGTLIFTKQRPLAASYGINGEYNDEGRIINLEFDKFFIVNSYSPNSKDGLLRIDYRMEFEDKLRLHLRELSLKKPVILCGDLNVAHEEIDLKNPKQNVGNAGFSNEERGKMTELIEAGFTDSFRHLYPDTTDAYTWWSYRAGSRPRGIGWRIDYFIVSDDIKSKIQKAEIHADILGSDHCPVSLEIDL